jgi:hypothetical protein
MAQEIEHLPSKDAGVEYKDSLNTASGNVD